MAQEAQNPNRIKLVISDFHLSRGRWLADGRRNPLENFHQDEKLRQFLDFYSTGPYAQTDVELIINGDFFDPLAVIPIPHEGKKIPEFPIEVEEAAAIRQFQSIVAGHPVSFAALKMFLDRGKRIVLRWGNHDAALLWPGVQAYVRSVLKPQREEQVTFQLEPYVFDRVCVDHGHQHEIINQFDEKHLFMTRTFKDGPKTIQNLPFGSFFVMGFINRLKLNKSYIDQVYPFRNYLKLSVFFEPLFFITNGFRVAWFFIKMRFLTHPARFARFRKTLRILGEIVHRTSLEHEAEKILTGSNAENLPYDTLIMGHNHQAQLRVFQNGKQYINTGTWTPITSLDMSTLGHRVLRTYALIEYLDGKARTSLKIWHGQPQAIDDFV